MGDYTTHTFVVRRVALAQRDAVVNVFNNYLSNEFDSGWDDQESGFGVFGGEASFGAEYEVRDALESIIAGDSEAPAGEFAYALWVDPHYEHSGTMFMHVPGRRDYSGWCDGSGLLYVRADELYAVIDSANTLDDLRRDIERLTGRKTVKAFDSYRLTDITIDSESGIVHSFCCDAPVLLVQQNEVGSDDSGLYYKGDGVNKGHFSCGACGTRLTDKRLEYARSRNALRRPQDR